MVIIMLFIIVVKVVPRDMGSKLFLGYYSTRRGKAHQVPQS